jgi:hypothetical protein
VSMLIHTATDLSAILATDLPQTITPEPVENTLLRCHIDSQLTLNSLILLGFDSDEYIRLYSGIAFDLLPLNQQTFDHPSTSVKMLLIVLHYLLCILDPEHFLLDIASCWPYLDSKERNNFKHAIHRSVKRLVIQGRLSPDVYLASMLNEQNNLDKTYTWHLLRILTDLCLEAVLPPVSLHRMPEIWISEDREALLEAISNQVNQVIVMMTDHHNEQEEQKTYLDELLHRAAIANEFTEQSGQPIERSPQKHHYSCQSRHHASPVSLNAKRKILGAKGIKIRSEKLQSIKQKRELLQALLDAPLLANIEELLKIEAGQKATQNLPSEPGKQRALRRAKSNTNMEVDLNTMKDSITLLIGSIDSAVDLI